MAKQNIFPANIVDKLTRNPSQYITTMLIGNNLALVIYGIVMAKLIEPAIRNYFVHDGMVLFVQTIISTFVILFVAEFLPKTLFRINPNQTLRIFAIPVYFFYLIFVIIIFRKILLTKE